MAKIAVTVTVVPASGKSTEKTVEVEASGATLAEVLKAADVDTKDMQISIDGKPADVGAHVKSGAKIKANAKVTATERAMGS